MLYVFWMQRFLIAKPGTARPEFGDLQVTEFHKG